MNVRATWPYVKIIALFIFRVFTPFQVAILFPLQFLSNKWSICQYLMTAFVRCSNIVNLFFFFSLCHIALTTLFMIQQKAGGNWSCQCLRRNKFNLFWSFFKFFIVICSDSEISFGATRLCCLDLMSAPLVYDWNATFDSGKSNESYLRCHEIFISLCQRSFSN